MFHIRTIRSIKKVILWEVNSESKDVKFVECLCKQPRIDTCIEEDRIYFSKFDISKTNPQIQTYVLMLLGDYLGHAPYTISELFTDFDKKFPPKKDFKERGEIIVNTPKLTERVIIEVPTCLQEDLGLSKYIRTRKIPPEKITKASNSVLMKRGIDPDPEASSHYGVVELDFDRPVFCQAGFSWAKWIENSENPENKFKVHCYKTCHFREMSL